MKAAIVLAAIALGAVGGLLISQPPLEADEFAQPRDLGAIIEGAETRLRDHLDEEATRFD